MNRKEIFEKLLFIADKHGSRNPQQLKLLKRTFSTYDKNEVFEGCLEVFKLSQPNSFERQQLSGRMLYAIRPKIHFKLEEVLRPCLEHYDVSVEELPWYFCSLMGNERVLDVVKKMEQEVLSEKERINLETFGFWAKNYGT